MKILIVTETLLEGGAELFALRLARGLLQENQEVLVLNLNRAYENKLMTDEYKDVPIQRLDLPALSFLDWLDKCFYKLRIDFSIKYFLQLQQLKKILKRYDIVHSHYIQVDHLVSKIKKNRTFKQVVTVHGDYSAQYDSFVKGKLRLWLRLDKKLDSLKRNVDQWVVISDEQKKFFNEIVKVPEAKVKKIYNGYAVTNESRPVPPGINELFIIGMVSRGHPMKGWQQLIDAFIPLPAHCRLILVGQSDYLDSLKEKYTYEKRIVFTGFESQPLKRLSQFDIFVFPTQFKYESLPTVIIEAMACEVPVVATDVGEVKNMITAENKTMAGFTIDMASNDVFVKNLHEKLKELISDPVLLGEMKISARSAFKKFDMKKCIEAYILIYRSS